MPQYKLDRFEQHASLACEGDADAWRTALGELASFTTALRLSRMLGRWLREWSGNGTPDSVWAAQFLQFYRDALPLVNGKAWRADIAPAVPVVSDARFARMARFARTSQAAPGKRRSRFSLVRRSWLAPCARCEAPASQCLEPCRCRPSCCVRSSSSASSCSVGTLTGAGARPAPAALA